MIYSVEIDDQSRTGKSLISFLKDLSKSSKAIRLIETVKDDELLAKMLRSKKSGRSSRKEINQTLKAILER